MTVNAFKNAYDRNYKNDIWTTEANELASPAVHQPRIQVQVQVSVSDVARRVIVELMTYYSCRCLDFGLEYGCAYHIIL